MTERNHRGSEPPPRRDEAIEALLRRYADERLRLDAAASRRLREGFRSEAARRVTPPTSLDVARARRPWVIGRRPARRAAVALLAAAVALGAVAGAAAASSPGGPLYGVRLWVETLTLPGDAAARADAEIARLEARLSEATDAAERGNGAAVRAALEAYRETIASALQAAGTDLERTDRLEIVLERHQVVLDTLAGRLPAPAAAAVEQTIERNEATIEKIKTHGKPSSTPEPGGGESPAPSAAPSHEPGGPPSPKPGRTPPGQGQPSP